jgi:hypothetical protein
MSDLASGRYPDSEETWAQDGFPVPPDRHGLVKPIGAGNGGLTLATTIMYVYPFVAQAGDIYRYIRFIAKTQATSTSTHAWVAVYNGVATGAALLGQIADTAAGWAPGLVNIALATVVSNIGTVGTEQGPSTAAIVPQGPAVWGLAFYNVTSGTGNILDAAAAAGSLAGEQLRSTQAPLCSESAAVSTTATAPAVLPTMTATTAAYPLFSLTAS